MREREEGEVRKQGELAGQAVNFYLCEEGGENRIIQRARAILKEPAQC